MCVTMLERTNEPYVAEVLRIPKGNGDGVAVLSTRGVVAVGGSVTPAIIGGGRGMSTSTAAGRPACVAVRRLARARRKHRPEHLLHRGSACSGHGLDSGAIAPTLGADRRSRNWRPSLVGWKSILPKRISKPAGSGQLSPSLGVVPAIRSTGRITQCIPYLVHQLLVSGLSGSDTNK